MIIYKVTNKQNNKIYIGQTTLTLNSRKGSHLEKSKANSETNFHRALRKYPENAFVWESIYECSNKIELNEAEIEYIEKYNSYKNGYNMTKGGDGGVTYNKGSELYNRIKHKLGKWDNGNPGATPEAIVKRVKSFKTVKWPEGENHGNYGKHRSELNISGKNNGMFGKLPTPRSVIIDNIIYESLGSAAKAIGVTGSTIKNRTNSKTYKNYKWNFLNKQK